MVFADFENGLIDWKSTGNAFTNATVQSGKHFKSVVGYSGKAWVSSLNIDPKKSKGLLMSPKFIVEDRFLNFLVGEANLTK